MAAAVRRRDLYAALEALAPLALAEDWDNVGVLLDPYGGDAIERVLLAIDLNESVADEAIGWGADAIVAYHPPIFGGVKRLTPADAQGRMLLRLIGAGVPVYAPHTALDAAVGGMAEWLAASLGDSAMLAPIAPCARRPLDSSVGQGRMGMLATAIPLEDAIERVKAHLGLQHVRVAIAARHSATKADGTPGGQEPAPIERFAVCPGAGGALLNKVQGMDLLLTGELRHHDVLAHLGAGTSVILTDHSASERGYLPLLAQRLQPLLPGVALRVSSRDVEPLVTR